MTIVFNAKAFFAPPSPEESIPVQARPREETEGRAIVVAGTPEVETQEKAPGSGEAPRPETISVPAQSPQAESERPILVRAPSRVDGAPPPTPQSPRKKTPCLQLPVYPAEPVSFHRPRTIEEYKTLLILATRSIWTDRFSEADYLRMERELGMDKYRPKVPTRTCEAAEEGAEAIKPAESSGQANQDSEEAKPVETAVSSMPIVVVPAKPKSRKSKTPAPRAPGTYL